LCGVFYRSASRISTKVIAVGYVGSIMAFPAGWLYTSSTKSAG
jgi:hypothetical protein